MDTKQIIEKAVSLTVEERALLVDSLLRTLNQTQSGIDKKWADVANERLLELRHGTVEAVPSQKVFDRIWKRFDK